MTTTTKQHDSGAQRASDANRQTGERERLAGILDASAGNPTLHKWQREQYAKAAAQLRAADAEIERLRAEVERYKALYIDCHNALDETKRELAELRERMASLQDAFEKAPVIDTYVERVSDDESIVWLQDSALPDDFAGHRVRLVRED